MKTLIHLALITCMFVLTTPAYGQGNLLITPQRVVFEGNRRMQDLNLANTGSDSARYVISIVQIRMKENGAFEPITEPDSGQRFADPYLRFFPRSVTLAPKEAQVVKVQLIKTNLLTPGEYRSHVYFRAVPDLKPLGEQEPVKDTAAISVKLTPIFGITIPVIIRVGESNTIVHLTGVTLNHGSDTAPLLEMIFERSGDMSVYGDLSVVHISPEGRETIVGIVKGIAVYTPNKRRRFSLTLDTTKKVDYHSGALHLTYTAPSDLKSWIFAETTLLLN